MRISAWIALFLLAFPVATTSVANATQEVLLEAVEDASVRSAEPDNNFALDDRLAFGNGIGELDYFTRALLRFDVSGFSAVDLAELYIHKVACTGCPVPYELHQLSATWAESTVTWNNQPSTGAYVISNSAFADGSLQIIDLTALVQEWVGGQSVNYGIQLRGTNELGVQIAEIASDEWPDSSERPILRVVGQYTPVEPLSWGRIKRLFGK